MLHFLALPVTEEISFVQPTLEQAEAIFNAVDNDRKHLGEFLDFIDTTKSIADEVDFLKMKITGEANGTDRLFLIYYHDQLAGSIDLHFIDQKNKKAEIGYWIYSGFANKGIVSASVRKICEIAFNDLHLNKLTLIADTENIASNKVAQKCGFTFVATDKEDVVRYGKFHDMNRYCLLKQDYLKNQ